MTHPNNSSPPPRRRRFVRELGAALVLLVVIVLLLFAHRWHTAHHDVDEAIAETNRLDPGWRFEELEAQRCLPPPEENSALQVLAVHALLPRGWSERPNELENEDRGAAASQDDWSPERRLREEEVCRLTANLAANGPALEQARKLADMPRGRYPVSWTADILSTPYPWLDPVINTSELLIRDELLRNEEGDSDGALASARAIINLGRSFGEEPFLGGPEFRNSRRWTAAAAIERTLAQGEPSDAALATTQAAVEREEAIPLLLLCFRGRRAWTHLFLSRVDVGDNRLSEWSCVPTRGWHAHAEIWFSRTKAMQLHARYLRGMNEAVEIAKLPLEEQYPRYQNWRKEKGDVEHVGDGLTFNLGTAETRLFSGHARLRCAAIGLAAERYRLKQGDWPPSLANLVPQYFSAVPLDPFDGKPLRYRRTDRGAVIYSVGKDGHDDGGHPNRLPDATAPRDVVFTLWNVNQRRQPPKPPAPAPAPADRGADLR